MQDDIVRRQPPQAPEEQVVVQQNPDEQATVAASPENEAPAQPVTEESPATEPVNVSADSEQKPPDLKPKSNTPTGIIFTAVFVCLLLVGAAVYAGMRSSS